MAKAGEETGLDGPGEDVCGGGVTAFRALDGFVVGGTDPNKDVAGEE